MTRRLSIMIIFYITSVTPSRSFHAIIKKYENFFSSSVPSQTGDSKYR